MPLSEQLLRASWFADLFMAFYYFEDNDLEKSSKPCYSAYETFGNLLNMWFAAKAQNKIVLFDKLTVKVLANYSDDGVVTRYLLHFKIFFVLYFYFTMSGCSMRSLPSRCMMLLS